MTLQLVFKIFSMNIKQHIVAALQNHFSLHLGFTDIAMPIGQK